MNNKWTLFHLIAIIIPVIAAIAILCGIRLVVVAGSATVLLCCTICYGIGELINKNNKK